MQTSSWSDHLSAQGQLYNAFKQGLEAHQSGSTKIPKSVLKKGIFLQGFLAAATGAGEFLGMLNSQVERTADEIESFCNGIESSVYKAISAGVKPAAACATVLGLRDNPEIGSVGFAALKKGINEGLTMLTDGHLTPRGVDTYLTIADFLRQQTPYVEGVLHMEWVKPDPAHVAKVRWVIDRMQDRSAAEALSKRLDKISPPESAVSAPAPQPLEQRPL